MHRTTHAALALSLLTAPALASPVLTETFESTDVGAFPASPWHDIGTAAFPAPELPTGAVIDTTGLDGSPTRAFQVFQRRTTSQGIIADIDHATHHRVEADLRVDIHPTPVRFGDWTAAMGFFDQSGPAVDINAEPQGVVYVYQQKWHFYGSTVPSNNINIALSDTPVEAGAWYRVSLDADTATGHFTVTVRDAAGALVLDRAIDIPGFSAEFGLYNRVAVFDGEYSGRAATPGQFSADNIAYTPAPGGLSASLTLALAAAPRRRRARGHPPLAQPLAD